MKHAIKVHTFDDKSTVVTIPESVVESLYLVLHYEVSGDEVFTFVQDDGTLLTIDAVTEVPDATFRNIDCGPDNLEVIFPEDMQWENVHEA